MESKQLKTCGLICEVFRIGEQMLESSLGFSDFMEICVIICLLLSPPSAVFSYSASVFLSSNLPGCIAEQFPPIVRQNILNFRKAPVT